MSGYIYLASPYSHPDRGVREARFLAACRAAAQLMGAGLRVFCPIAHSHAIEEHGMDARRDGEFWLRQDGPLLAHAAELYVLMLDGWRESKGVQEEIRICELLGKPIRYVPWME